MVIDRLVCLKLSKTVNKRHVVLVGVDDSALEHKRCNVEIFVCLELEGHALD